jgi:hypothetical protein
MYQYYYKQKKILGDSDFGFATGQVTGYRLESPVLERSVNRCDMTHDYYSSVHDTSSSTLRSVCRKSMPWRYTTLSIW